MPLRLAIIWRDFRFVLLLLLAFLAGVIALLLGYDFLRPVQSLSFGPVVLQLLPPRPVGGLILALMHCGLPLGLFGAVLWRHVESRVSHRRRRILLGAALLTALPGWSMWVECLLYDPLKFSYLIHRIETADTPAAEEAALMVASRFGNVWELNRLDRREWWPPSKQHLRGDSLLEVEWLESSAYTGQPYRAYRVLLDQRSLDSVYRRWERAEPKLAPKATGGPH